MYYFLSFLPVILLFILSIWFGIRTGVYATLIVTAILFFKWGNNILTFFASVLSAFIGTVNILMIIFGAVFLYHIMEQKGYISGIKKSLAEIHPDKSFRFFFLAFFLTAFFESVSGFGTPLAIVPLLLISIGYSPVVSISVVLLIDGLFSMAGAVGTPVSAGLEIPLNLNPSAVSQIYLYSAIQLFISGVIIFLFINRFVSDNSNINFKELKSGFILYLFIMIPFLLGSFFLRELTGLIASVVMALLSYLFLFKHKKLIWRPWIPYWVLVGLLLIPKFFLGFADLLSYKLEFTSIYGTDINASLQPFKSPLIPFLAAALFALYHSRNFTINLKPILAKTLTVFLILFPSLAITQLMINSGNENPSMLNMLAGVFIKTEEAYPLISPSIGVVGAFISGSSTVSNILFGSVQQVSAIHLGIREEIILSMQLSGASLGNALCLFNIIAAAAVTGTKEYSLILRKNIVPIILCAISCSLIGYLLMYLVK